MKARWCWVARETSKGWRLALSIGPVRGLVLVDPNDVSKVLNAHGKVVYVHMRRKQK